MGRLRTPAVDRGRDERRLPISGGGGWGLLAAITTDLYQAVTFTILSATRQPNTCALSISS